ncbi:hypothetical protein [Pollutimonas sp. M17]|uniref:hypothetical protein n=1 Tax=Pollutimonas sp. M17 TaxID=2962065 RepID=UPI0021F3DF22|nr:hypothetical protein [Pollutimonas sp. M17]UYO92206.1 hypothetical protein OEG81_09705 [Pollutimonas sp. M17]
MSISSVTYEALQKLVALDADLLTKLYDVQTLAEASRIIAASAGRHGITLDPGELNRYLQVSLDNSSASEVGDAELAGVAGGRSVFMPNTQLRRIQWIAEGKR